MPRYWSPRKEGRPGSGRRRLPGPQAPVLGGQDVASRASVVTRAGRATVGGGRALGRRGGGSGSRTHLAWQPPLFSSRATSRLVRPVRGRGAAAHLDPYPSFPELRRSGRDGSVLASLILRYSQREVPNSTALTQEAFQRTAKLAEAGQACNSHFKEEGKQPTRAYKVLTR